MTKKEEKAAEVLANKRTAFVRRVATLTGHVMKRIPAAEMNAAFSANKTADQFALSIAIREPVGAALHTDKEIAVRHAAVEAEKVIERVRKDLEAHGWDRNAAAPYPWRQHGFAADTARNKSNLYSSLTKAATDGYQSSRMNNEPYIVVMDEAGCARFTEQNERSAAMYYDAFIVKMVAKVGECDGATIEGSHVWSFSILTVTKGATVERWKTQQITNYSKLGLAYPQWPSRIIK